MAFRNFAPGDPEWERFASARAATLFAGGEWIRVLAAGLRAQPVHGGWMEKGKIVAGLPGVLIRRGVFCVLYASLPYSERLGSAVHFPLLLQGLRDWARRHGVDQLRVSLWPVGLSPPPGFREEPVMSTVLRLDPTGGPPDENYPATVRRNLRKAAGAGVVVASETGVAAADTACRLFALAMHRNLAPVRYPARYFRAVQRDIIDRGLGATLVARIGGDPVAALVCVRSGPAVHYIHGGSDVAALPYRPNDALFDAAIRWSYTSGARLFDFGYSAAADRPLIRFKEKWNASTQAAATWVLDVFPLKCRIMDVLRRVMLSRAAGVLRHGLATRSGRHVSAGP